MTATKKAAVGALMPIAIDKIRPNPFQPRTSFDLAEIKKLAASLESSGLLQPITVRAVDDGYELLAGERRTRAAESIGWTTIPAIVRAFADEEMAVLGLVENLQRADLAPLEEAEGLKRLADELGWSQARIAEETGIPRSTVGDRLRALELPDAWLALLRKGEIQFSHTPAIHKYRELRERAHTDAIEYLHDWLGLGDPTAGPISVEDFESELRSAYRSELHPLSELPSSYNGLVITVKQWSDDKPRRYAADREKWEPLLEAKRAADAKKARAKSKAGADETSARPQVDYAAQEKKNREKAAKLTATREAQLDALLAKVPASWDAPLWRFVVEQLAEGGGYTTMAVVYALVAPEKTSDYAKMTKAVHAHLAEIDIPALQGLALRILLARETTVSPYNLQQKPKHLMAIAQLLGTSLDELAPTPKVPTQPAGELLSVFTVGRLGKSLVKKSLDEWPNDLLAYQVKSAREQLAKFDDPLHSPLPEGLNHSTRESAFLHGVDRNTVVADLALLTKAAQARDLDVDAPEAVEAPAPKRSRKKAAVAAVDVEVPVHVSDDDVQAIRAATEHDEQAAGSGDEELEDDFNADDAEDDSSVWDTAGDDLEEREA